MAEQSAMAVIQCDYKRTERLDNYRTARGCYTACKPYVSDNEAPIRFEDIYAVYADTTQLIKTSITSGFVFPDCFYKKGDNLAVKMQKTPNFIKLIYHIKPKLIKVNENDEIQYGNVMIPIEFIELVKSKLRGEAYSLENEYGPASNWLNNYNILLENFKQWLSDKAQQFGQ